MATKEKLATCIESLRRMQLFDVGTIARVEDLGKDLNFSESVPYAQRLVDLYRRIPIVVLDDLTDGQLDQLRKQIDADYNRFDSALQYSSKSGAGPHTDLSNQIRDAYDVTFSLVWQYIAFGVARVTNSSVLENEARATIQTIRDQAESLTSVLKEHQEGANAILANIKRVAAEAGVSQQAEHFKAEADSHEGKAGIWESEVKTRAVWVGGFAVLSLFLHKIPWIAPENAIESAQLISSKILIFVVLGYLLVLAAKNYLSHRHNAVVNRHRQNALLTYRALADAAQETATEDIVLAHAASCIFAPQETGYTRGSDASGASKSVLELLTKASARAS